MKRFFIAIICILMLSSLGMAESSLEEGQSKIFTHGPLNYTITARVIRDDIAVFFYNGMITKPIAEFESYDFDDGVSIAVSDISLAGDAMRVRFVLDVPSIDCGRFRCFPGQECLDSTCIDIICGDSICNIAEDCGSCAADCGCGEGFVCEASRCVEEVIDVQAPEVEVISEEPIIEELSIFSRFWNWLSSLFN